MSNTLKPADKLKALGLKLPESQESPLKEEFDELKKQVENLSNGFSEFQNDVNNQSSFSEFETYLTDTLGLSASEASKLRKKYESKYTDFSTFQNELSSYSSFEEWRNSFSWGDTLGGETTEDGQATNAGIRFHGEAGITREGVQVPAGTVEIFGPEVHFSQTGATADEEEDKSSLFSWSNESVDNATPVPYEDVTFSADLTNNGSYRENFVAALLVDGETVTTGDLFKIGPGNTRTVEFTYEFGEIGSYEVQISKSATIDVTVIPPQLIQ